MNKIVNFWGKPRTIENVIKNRKISWLELFYDLIFAVVFSRLTESLLEHQTLTGFINAILTFFWLIWGWGEFNGYFDNHGNDSIINILIINIDMILELFMGAVWIDLGIFDKTHGPAARVWGITCYSCNHCLRPLF
ncbi:low temperature requirement protein A [Lactobacillus amylovorus]|uniref:Low temperature requirement protein A n=2 Tax=Lactobacillus amylovorus TaxID=1604 RepID=A0A9X3W6U9_LACAM|nr:low temperature requirement protein A [Lactobacillus amylovorus]MDB6261265.1 low temperature requirement protein A [Lactobacillus amylovorus]MDB6266242.1 low temperature requirement protein A [Lactobacillus amylovorus]